MADSIKPKTIFDFLNDICFRKIAWSEQTDKKRFQPYMVNRWLSMHPDYLEIVSEVQPITSRLEPREFYYFFVDLLPKRKFYVKYIKSDANDDKLSSFIADKLKISKRDALETIDVSSPDDLKEWIRGYGYTDAEIKKYFSI